jgi:hypothetical protein
MKSEKKSPGINIHITIINIVILIGYTIFLKYNQTGGFNFIADAFFIFLQGIICIILAGLFERFRKSFILRAALVLLIGFSTCYMAIN